MSVSAANLSRSAQEAAQVSGQYFLVFKTALKFSVAPLVPP